MIRRHETAPRGYYSGVAALFTPTGRGHDLDAPILIRTAYIEEGRLRVPAGATLVRHSDPYSEVAETHGKAAGVLGAIGAIPRAMTSVAGVDEDDPGLRAAAAVGGSGDRGAARLAQFAARAVLDGGAVRVSSVALHRAPRARGRC